VTDAQRLELRGQLIAIAKKRDVPALRAFTTANPVYDSDLAKAVEVSDDEELLTLLVTMASWARHAEEQVR